LHAVQRVQLRSQRCCATVNSGKFSETEPMPEPTPMPFPSFRPAAVFVAAIALALTSCTAEPTEPEPDPEPDPPLGAGLRTRMYAHDISGDLATIDMTNGVVTYVGNMVIQMRDIAFDDEARLFAISGGHLFRIDTLTGARTVIAEEVGHNLYLPNALAASSDGTLYAAGPNNTLLHTLDPITSVPTLVGDMGHKALGDMAFHQGWLYLVSDANLLIKVDHREPENSVVIGPLGVTGMFGLATGPDGYLYGNSGTTLYRVDPVTGAATSHLTLSGYALGEAWGLACRCGP
jgi:hypothetical protein